MKLEPLGDKVIVRRIEAEATTAGGIVLPESAREKPRQGKVLSVGDGALGTSGVRARPWSSSPNAKSWRSSIPPDHKGVEPGRPVGLRNQQVDLPRPTARRTVIIRALC